jgi:beta-galactosidase
MHSGLLRPDRVDDVAAHEARAAAADIATIGTAGDAPKQVALVFSYEAAWVIETQPQGADFRYFALVMAMYTALRRLGLNIDIVPPDAALDGYRMVVVPTLPILPEGVSDYPGPILFGPRTGSKTADFAIPENLPPGPLQTKIPLKVTRVESSRDEPRWREHVETDLVGDDGVYRASNIRYLSHWPDAEQLANVFSDMASEAGLTVMPLHADLRIRRFGDLIFAFNYGPESVTLPPASRDFVLGGDDLEPAGVAVWRDV